MGQFKISRSFNTKSSGWVGAYGATTHNPEALAVGWFRIQDAGPTTPGFLSHKPNIVAEIAANENSNYTFNVAIPTAVASEAVMICDSDGNVVQFSYLGSSVSVLLTDPSIAAERRPLAESCFAAAAPTLSTGSAVLPKIALPDLVQSGQVSRSIVPTGVARNRQGHYVIEGNMNIPNIQCYSLAASSYERSWPTTRDAYLSPSAIGEILGVSYNEVIHIDIDQNVINAITTAGKQLWVVSYIPGDAVGPLTAPTVSVLGAVTPGWAAVTTEVKAIGIQLTAPNPIPTVLPGGTVFSLDGGALNSSTAFSMQVVPTSGAGFIVHPAT